MAESAGQTQRTDRTLQDALCAIASRGQQDKAIICPDTSLACSPQLSRGTVDCRAPGSPPQRNTDIHHPGLQTFRNQRTKSVLGEAPAPTQGAQRHSSLQRNSLLVHFQIQTSTGLTKTNTGEHVKNILLNLDFLCFTQTFHVILGISTIQLEKKNARTSI